MTTSRSWVMAETVAARCSATPRAEGPGAKGTRGRLVSRHALAGIGADNRHGVPRGIVSGGSPATKEFFKSHHDHGDRRHERGVQPDQRSRDRIAMDGGNCHGPVLALRVWPEGRHDEV